MQIDVGGMHTPTFGLISHGILVQTMVTTISSLLSATAGCIDTMYTFYILNINIFLNLFLIQV